MKKTIISILLLALFLAGVAVYFIFNQKSAVGNLPKAENQNNGQNTQPNNPDNIGQDNSSLSQEQVLMQGFAFKPALLEIKIGSTVCLD